MKKKKLKANWVKTDIPKHVKIRLWLAMKDNPTYQSWQQSTAGGDFEESDDKYVRLSYETYKSLKDEIIQMPLEEVGTLPLELQSWILALRPDLKKEQTKQKAEKATTTSGKQYQETPHKQQMRKLAKTLAQRIILPSLWDKDLWRDLLIEFQPGKYSLPIGAVEIDKDKQIKVNYYDIGAGIAAPHLVKGLYSHLSTSGLSKFAELMGDKGKLDDWVSGVGKYSEALLRFLKLIADEVKGYKARVNFHDEAKPGLTRWFLLIVWNDVIQRTGGYSWIDDSWYHPPENIPGTSLWQLRCGAYGIGIARSKKTLKTYENWHKKLRVMYTDAPLVKEISAKYQDLNKAAQEISQLLHEFGDMERLPGCCELC